MSDAMMPRIMDTIPPSLWFRATRATVTHITSSHPNDHVLDFMQEDIPPATTDLNDHNNALTNLWAQKIFTEEIYYSKELSTLLEKQAARRAARATRNSKGAQSEDRTQTPSKSPPKIETIPHTFSVGAWILDAYATL